MATLGTAYVQILPSAEGIDGKLKEALGAPSTNAGKSAGMNIGGAIGTYAKKFISAAAIGTAIKKSVEEGAKLEQSLGGVETLYKKHADLVIKNANKAYKTAGLSANEYMEQSTTFAASLLNSLGGDTKKAAQYADMAVKDMSDNANKFGTDIQSIQDAYQGFSKQNYTMLDDLKLGYGGTKSEMERLLQDAEKLSGKKYDISNLSDVYDAIHEVQKELGVTGTTAAEADKTISGSFNSMKAAAKNFFGALALGGKDIDLNGALSGLISSAGTFLFQNLVPTLLNVISLLPGALLDGLSQAVNGLSTAIIGFVDKAMSDPSFLVSGAKALGGILKGIIDNADQVFQALAKLFGAAVPKALMLGLKLIVDGAGKMFNAIGTLLTSTLPKAFGLTSLVSAIKSGASKAVSAAKTQFAKITNTITAPVRKAYNGIKSAIDKIKGVFHRTKLKLGIKIPHISVRGGKAPFGIGGKGHLPSFSVHWAAKGGIVDGATLIGAGEKGKEAIVPLDPFWKKLDERDNGGVIDYDRLAAAILNAINGMKVSTNVNLNDKTIVEAIAPLMVKTIDKINARKSRKLGYV